MTLPVENTRREMSGNDQPQHQYTVRLLVLFFVLTFILTWSFLIPTLSAITMGICKRRVALSQ
jgi:hypothetical protein